jgi:hypothetical protein
LNWQPGFFGLSARLAANSMTATGRATRVASLHLNGAVLGAVQLEAGMAAFDGDQLAAISTGH